MQEKDFKAWLASNYDTGTCNARLANCKRVEAFEGDLDNHFQVDKCEELLERLMYTREDERYQRPPLHKVPIEGNVYNGTSTLKSAIRLYVEFKKDDAGLEVEEAQLSSVQKTKLRKSEWPEWDQPSEADILQFAKLSIPYFKFLSPEIVRAIVEDNNMHKEEWIQALKARDINPDAYLWNKSACVFPGVRRYAGSKEIAIYRGHVKEAEKDPIEHAVTLDDNSYPKQIWSFIFRGRKFANFGPYGYALAHLADHKAFGNRYAQDFEISEELDGEVHLFGLYTSAANSIYVPNSLLKSTDFNGPLRNLLMRRAQELYGDFCNLLPLGLVVPQNDNKWDLESFSWSEPVGSAENIGEFLKYRREEINKIIGK